MRLFIWDDGWNSLAAGYLDENCLYEVTRVTGYTVCIEKVEDNCWHDKKARSAANGLPVPDVKKELKRLGLNMGDTDINQRLDLLTSRIDQLAKALNQSEKEDKRREMFERLSAAIEVLETSSDLARNQMAQYFLWQLTSILETAETLTEIELEDND